MLDSRAASLFLTKVNVMWDGDFPHIHKQNQRVLGEITALFSQSKPMRHEPKRCLEPLNSGPKRFELHVDLIQLYALIWYKPAGSKCCKSSLTLNSQRELIKQNVKHDFAKINHKKIMILIHFLHWGCPLRTHTYDKCNVNVCQTKTV